MSIEGLIGSLDFPIAVTVWLFYRDSKKEDDFSRCLADIKMTVENNTKALDNIRVLIEKKIG